MNGSSTVSIYQIYISQLHFQCFESPNWIYMGVSKKRRNPKWMAYNNGKPYMMSWGYPYFRKHPYVRAFHHWFGQTLRRFKYAKARSRPKMERNSWTRRKRWKKLSSLVPQILNLKGVFPKIGGKPPKMDGLLVYNGSKPY